MLLTYKIEWYRNWNRIKDVVNADRRQPWNSCWRNVLSWWQNFKTPSTSRSGWKWSIFCNIPGNTLWSWLKIYIFIYRTIYIYYKCQLFFKQVTCTVLATGRRKTIPVVVTISDINDNAPKFLGTPYQVTVPEVSITYLQYSKHRSKYGPKFIYVYW